MAIPFDLQKFSGEIITAIVTAVVLQVPKVARWTKSRFSPTPTLLELRITASRASLRFLNNSTTDAELDIYLEIISLSGKEFQLDHFQVHWLHFDNVQLPQADGRVVPPHVVVPKRGVAEPHVRIRLHPAEIQTIVRAAVQAQNVYSSPRHHLRLGLIFVAKRRFSTVNVGPKEVEVANVEVNFPSTLFPPER